MYCDNLCCSGFVLTTLNGICYCFDHLQQVETNRTLDFQRTYDIRKQEHQQSRIVSYVSTGVFRDPSVDEVTRHTFLPFKIFQPHDGSYTVTFYSYAQVALSIVGNL